MLPHSGVQGIQLFLVTRLHGLGFQRVSFQQTTYFPLQSRIVSFQVIVVAALTCVRRAVLCAGAVGWTGVFLCSCG